MNKQRWWQHIFHQEPKSHVGETEPIQEERLFTDSDYFKHMLLTNRENFITQLERRYQILSRQFIAAYIRHIETEHLDNPLASLYTQSELGAPLRQLTLVQTLASQGLEITGKKCLDIGCSNGALALACTKSGAREVLGIDICPGRLQSAANLCAGSPVRLKNVNILQQTLGETFDVILCTDVLEHVPDPRALFHQIHAHLDNNPQAFAYFSLFNKNVMQSILSEPHYNVPGMILLPYEEARALWYEVRQSYHSKLDYEVFHWFSYQEYQHMAEEAHLELKPLHQGDFHTIAHLVYDYCKNTADTFEKEFERAIKNSPVPLKYRQLIQQQIDVYLAQYRSDHANALPFQNGLKMKDLYLKYYAHPLMMVVKHK